MDYDREEMRRRREYDEALAAQKKLEQKLAGLKRAARTAKVRLLSTTKSETWHRMSLGWIDRDAGYAGEMVSARVWLRCQPLHAYTRIMETTAAGMGAATNLQIEVAAVNANLAEWTVNGDALLLERAKRDYAADGASFEAWRHDHPDHDTWRKKPATRAQGFFVARMATALDIQPPSRMNRGEAHDWIAGNGGNPRLAGEPPVAPAPSSPAPPPDSVDSGQVEVPAGEEDVL